MPIHFKDVSETVNVLPALSARSAGAIWPKGACFGRYRIERPIGAGGMGSVYEAVHTLLRKRVALKLMHPSLGISNDDLVCFLREAESAARIQHTNVVDISDVGIEQGVPFMVMDLLEGEDLAQRLARAGRLDARTAVDLLLPIVAGLAAAHRLGVLHGDLKPENIFLAVDERGCSVPKLLDFGLSRDLSGASGPNGVALSGTPHYMAPEQLRHGPVDARTDQYALGVVMYRCLSGVVPFGGASLCDLMIAIDRGELRPLRELRGDLEEGLVRVVERAMASDREDRYSTTEDLGSALLAFASPHIRDIYRRELEVGCRPSTPPERWSEADLAQCCVALLENEPRDVRAAVAWSDSVAPLGEGPSTRPHRTRGVALLGVLLGVAALLVHWLALAESRLRKFASRDAVEARGSMRKAIPGGYMKRFSLAVFALGLALAVQGLEARSAHACGGFFCSSTPVDQNAERVVFKIRDDGRTDMIVQISYQGKAEDFAWLLPLAEPPKESDLAVFPQRALTALDAQTGVVVSAGCRTAGGALPSANRSADEDESSGAVDVYVRTQIGNYEVAVIGSKDPLATAQWLEDNDFRISDAMIGFIKLYTEEGMKFLALKLLPDKTANDITPFKLTLPGQSPSIPLRLSAVAAEPEMGIVVWIFGNGRYGPANVNELTIDNKDLRLDTNYQSNWMSLVARAVDEAQGRGFVVEDAEPVTNLLQLAQGSFTTAPDQVEAQKALVDLFANTTYMTRLYTRLSPEEMTFDPIFKRSTKGDVSRFRTIESDNQCTPPAQGEPCDFVACGALGLCRAVASGGQKTAACACAGGSTARATFVPSPNGGFASTVSCIDKRLSFLNPGDRNAVGEALPDPCVGIDCGGHGTCVPMNMTPTCACERGYVAQAVVATDGSRSARCLMPMSAVPDKFYNRRPVERAAELPVGRSEELPVPTGRSDADDPVPEGNMAALPGGSKTSSNGCSVTAGARAEGAWGSAFACALGLGVALRRRPKRRAS